MEAYRYLWAPPLIFLVGFLLLRIAGKRAVANMSNFDLFLVSSLGSSLGGFITAPGSLGRTFIGVTLLVATYLGFSFLVMNNSIRKWVLAKPSVLINKGHINERGLRDARMTIPELLGHLRIKGYPVVGDVEFAVMEEAGEISVVGKKQTTGGRAIPVLLDGEWIVDNLHEAGVSKINVLSVLSQHGIEPDQVGQLTLVTVDDTGGVWYDTHDRPKSGGQTPKQYESLDQAATGVLSQEPARITAENDVEKQG